MDLHDQIEVLECAVWQALLTGDAEADAALLAEDFLGLYPTGYATRAEHAEQLADGPSIARYALSDIRVRAVGVDHALICYHAEYLRTGRDVAEAMWVSSLWRRDGAEWINVFSQDTPVGGPVP